ncbi:MAG: DUF6171 family protein [Clostridium sp.]|jgi:hypothetical protein|nr:DUF6171 family protein [Clostridium sp.]
MNQDEIRRICKKCLPDQIGEDEYFETLHSYVENIDPNEKAREEDYSSRLFVCAKCEKLREGMCAACGCFVELRAAYRKNRCPYGYWE